MQDICKVKIPFDFKTVYLSYISPDIKGIDNYLMAVLLTAGKKALTKRWMTPVEPSINNWIDVTTEIYKMEKITFSY